MSNLTLDHFLAMKREWEARLPPPMLALKCHPATEAYVRRSIEAERPTVLPDLYQPPIVYRDVDVPQGKVLVATSRHVADLWRWQAQMKYAAWLRDERTRLVVVLGRRLAMLEGEGRGER